MEGLALAPDGSISTSREREFSGRRILLTGASGSIGRVTAVKLAEAGAHVVINGRDVAKLEPVAAKMPAGSFTIASFDLNDTDGIVNWMRELADKAGPFAGIAHTAGLQALMPLRTLTAAFTDKMLHANVTTGIMLGKALRQKSCHIDGASFVLLSSTAYFCGGNGNVAYAASKGAVTAMTKAMAQELLRDKIRVNCVTPGLVESDLSERAHASTTPEAWQRVLSGYPLGLGKPEDIAYAIMYLLSDGSRWVTGTELQIEGGLTIA
jgi:NAD(P)-dependent dehydrogenase (short-subunit alcohol dehydrogenase family)